MERMKMHNRDNVAGNKDNLFNTGKQQGFHHPVRG